MTQMLMPRSSRSSKFLPLGLTWLAFAFRLYHLTFQSLWRDESDALRFATRTLPELLDMFRRPGENGPLFFLGLRPWLAAVGHSEFALRFPSALAGTLAVPLVYVLVRRLAGHWPALVSALLMATAPYLVWYGQEAKMYALLSALIPLSLWLTVQAAQRGGILRWLALYVVTTLSIYTHLLAALVVPVQLLWLLLTPPRPETQTAQGRRRWLITAGYAAALLLPYLPLAVWQAEMLFSSFETGHPFVPLPSVFRVLAVAFAQGVLPLPHALLLLPALLALLAGVLLWAQEPGHKRLRVLAMLLAWLLLPPLALFAISLGMPLFLDRYLIWITPAFLALVAVGLVSLARAWRPLGVLVLGAVLAVNLWSVGRQASLPIKSDFRSAAAYVLHNQQPDDVLVFHISYIRDIFCYYYGDEPGAPVDGPYTNGGMTEAELGALMAQQTTGAEHVWLIDSESSMWDERGLVRGWLEAHGAVTHHADFTRVSVTRYDLQ